MQDLQRAGEAEGGGNEGLGTGTPPDQRPAAGSFTAKGFDGMEKKK